MAVLFHQGDSVEISSVSTISLSSKTTVEESTIEGDLSGKEVTESSEANIIVLGKVGVGKARIINEAFQQEIFECRAVTEVVRGVSQREASIEIGLFKYNIKMFDTLEIINRRGSRIKISKTMHALHQYVNNLYPQGVNLILLVYRYEDISSSERKRLIYILNHLNKDSIPDITALVITGCALKNDTARKRIISACEENPQMRTICQFILKRVHVVGFIDITSVPDAMTEMHQAVNYRDALPIKTLIEQSHFQEQVTSVLFFYSGRFHRGCCKFPWHYCPCYDRLFTCWRWGYTWEECLHVSQKENA